MAAGAASAIVIGRTVTVIGAVPGVGMVGMMVPMPEADPAALSIEGGRVHQTSPWADIARAVGREYFAVLRRWQATGGRLAGVQAADERGEGEGADIVAFPGPPRGGEPGQ